MRKQVHLQLILPCKAYNPVIAIVEGTADLPIGTFSPAKFGIFDLTKARLWLHGTGWREEKLPGFDCMVDMTTKSTVITYERKLGPMVEYFTEDADVIIAQGKLPYDVAGLFYNGASMEHGDARAKYMALLATAYGVSQITPKMYYKVVGEPLKPDATLGQGLAFPDAI
jgi:hypothetical protein